MQVVPVSLSCSELESEGIMLDTYILASVAKQMMTSKAVELDGRLTSVSRTGGRRLRTVAFQIDGHEYQAIEQNPERPSRWGELARHGHQVVQFKDAETSRFIAVSVDGEVTVYEAGHRGKR